MLRTLLLAVFAATAALLFSSCSATQSSGHNFLTDYSKLRQKSKLGDRMTYEGGLAKVPNYDEVYLEEVRVFPPDNMADHKITQQDLRRLEREFYNALRDEINASRFELVPSAGPTALSIRAAIVERAKSYSSSVCRGSRASMNSSRTRARYSLSSSPMA